MSKRDGDTPHVHNSVNCYKPVSTCSLEDHAHASLCYNRDGALDCSKTVHDHTPSHCTASVLDCSIEWD